jgi:hypothetical protein
MEPFLTFYRVYWSEGWMRAKSLKTKVAEVHGNRTHQTRLPANPTGFEDRKPIIVAVGATGYK